MAQRVQAFRSTYPTGARCTVCGKTWSDGSADRKAYSHTRSTGHKTEGQGRLTFSFYGGEEWARISAESDERTRQWLAEHPEDEEA